MRSLIGPGLDCIYEPLILLALAALLVSYGVLLIRRHRFFLGYGPSAFLLPLNRSRKRAFLLLSECWRVWASPTGTTIGIGVVGALATIFLSIRSYGLFPIAFLGFALALLTLSAPALILRFVDSPTYARIKLQDRSSAEMIYVISLHISAACDRFACEAQRSIEDENGKAMLDGTAARRFDSYRRSELQNLDRIHSLKLEAARQLDIPWRRLCEYVLEYSPAIQRKGLIKFTDLLNDVRNARLQTSVNKGSDDSWAEFVAKKALADCRALISVAKSRSEIQRDLQDLQWLLAPAIEIASCDSASKALSSYSRMLTTIARKLDHVDQNQTKIFSSAVAFAFHKQRAYPGLDSNRAARRFCDVMASRPNMSIVVDRDLPEAEARGGTVLVNKELRLAQRSYEQIKRISRFLRVLSEGTPDDKDTEPTSALNRTKERIEWYLSSENEDRVKLTDLLEDLKAFSTYVRFGQAFSSQRIIQNLSQELNQGSGLSEEKTFVVTYAFSTTVCESLRRFPLAASSEDSSQGALARPWVLLMKPNEDSEDGMGAQPNDLLAARWMEHELKAGIKRDKRRFEHVAIGDEMILAHLVGKDQEAGKDQRSFEVIVLLGAEAYDENSRCYIRSGMLERLKALKRHLDGGKLRIIVLVEEYKQYPSEEFHGKEFFHDHMDSVSLLGRDTFGHVLVSDAE